MSDREGFVTTSDGVRLHFRVMGEGEPSVLVDGLPGLDLEYEALFQERAIAFYAPRGRGLSDPVRDYGEVTLKNCLADMLAVQDSLGMEEAAVIGWSYAGAVVAIYAKHHPKRVSRVVQVCPMVPRRFEYWPEGSTEAREYRRKMTSRVDPEDAARVDELFRAGAEETDPVEFTRALDRINVPARMGDGYRDAIPRRQFDPALWPNEWSRNIRRWFHALMADVGDYDWRPEIAGLEVPTLVVHGGEDGPAQGREEWCHRPNARMLTLPGVGHFPHLEAPDIFFPAVDEFLRGGWPSDAVELTADRR